MVIRYSVAISDVFMMPSNTNLLCWLNNTRLLKSLQTGFLHIALWISTPSATVDSWNEHGRKNWGSGAVKIFQSIRVNGLQRRLNSLRAILLDHLAKWCLTLPKGSVSESRSDGRWITQLEVDVCLMKACSFNWLK